MTGVEPADVARSDTWVSKPPHPVHDACYFLMTVPFPPHVQQGDQPKGLPLTPKPFCPLQEEQTSRVGSFGIASPNCSCDEAIPHH